MRLRPRTATVVSVFAEIKPIAEAVLARGPARLVGALKAPRDCVLAYHNVLPGDVESRGDPSLHISRSRFAAHLDRLQETCRLVPLSRLLLDPPAPDRDRPRVALTFDDGYRGALTVGVDELEGRRLPATFFVPPGRLKGRVFWWDLVTDRDGEPLRGMARRIALEVFRGEQEKTLEWADRCGFGRREVHPLARSASLDELDEAAARPGMTLGSHGWSHANLAALEEHEVAVELKRSLSWLRERYGDSALPVVSYPYGRSSPDVERTARAEGYRAGLRVSGGALPTGTREPWALPRINAPSGLSPHGLQLRLSGIVR